VSEALKAAERLIERVDWGMVGDEPMAEAEDLFVLIETLKAEGYLKAWVVVEWANGDRQHFNSRGAYEQDDLVMHGEPHRIVYDADFG
jgi:hypothetical protein